MPRLNRSALLLLLFTLSACERQPAVPQQSAGSRPSAHPVAPSANELANLRYPIIEAESGWAQLQDGVYSNPQTQVAVTLISGKTLIGDLTGDGQDDALVLLVTNAGASAVISDIALVSRQPDGALKVLATRNLGERIDLKGIHLVAGKISVDMVTQGPDDPRCCPTQRVKSTYTYSPVSGSGELIEEKP